MKRGELIKAFSLAINEFPDRARSHFTIVDPDNWWVISSDDPLVGMRSQRGQFEGPWHFSYANTSYTVYGSIPGYVESIMLFFDDLGINASEYSKGGKYKAREEKRRSKGSLAFQELGAHRLQEPIEHEAARGIQRIEPKVSRHRKRPSSKMFPQLVQGVCMGLGLILVLSLATLSLFKRPNAVADDEIILANEHKAKRTKGAKYEEVMVSDECEMEKQQHENAISEKVQRSTPTRHQQRYRNKYQAKLSQKAVSSGGQLHKRAESNNGRNSLTQGWMNSIAGHIATYYREVGKFPDDLNSLKAYTKSLRLKDEWGRNFKYGVNSGKWALSSSGKDGCWDTDDDIVMDGY